MIAASASEQSLATLLAGVAIVPPQYDLPVRGVDTDSRRLRAGAAFLACASHDGQRHGLDWLDQALEKKPSAVIWESASGRQTPQLDLPVIEVPALTRHVGKLAARSLGHPGMSLQIVGVTGTDGKTSVAHLLTQALGALGKRCAYLGTLGYGELDALESATHTTPDAVALQQWLAVMKQQGMDSIAMEVSSHALAQHRVDAVNFDVAVLTNLGRDHLDYHGEVPAYHAAKRRLFELPDLEAVILNQDDSGGAEWLVSFADEGLEAARISYGLTGPAHPAAEYHILADAVTAADGLALRIRSSWGEGELHSRLLGRFNASNLLAVLAVLLQRGFDLPVVLDALAGLTPVPGRMQVVGKPDTGMPLAVVDYAHTPQALEQALQTLREHAAGRLWCVFGCGGDRDRGKRPLMAAAAEKLADFVVVADDNPRGEDPARIVDDIKAGFTSPEDIAVIHDRARAIQHCIRSAGPDDIVLVAGKGHEDYQLVGDQRLRFDDREAVEAALRSRPEAAC